MGTENTNITETNVKTEIDYELLWADICHEVRESHMYQLLLLVLLLLILGLLLLLL